MIHKEITAKRAAEIAKREWRLKVEMEEKRIRVQEGELSELLATVRETLSVPSRMTNRHNFGILRAFTCAPWSA